MSGRAKYRQCRLQMLFGNKRLHWRQAMNLLQEGPEFLISDLCVTPEEVHPDDAAAVCRRAGAHYLLPIPPISQNS